MRRVCVCVDRLFCQLQNAPSFSERAHEIHHGVDEAPRQIATESRHHDRPHLVRSSGGDGQRTDNRHRHDQAEDDLRDSIDRVQQSIPLGKELGSHQIVTAGSMPLAASGSEIRGKVASTGGWDKYQRVKIGRVTLADGEARITMQPAGQINGALLDLRRIELVPARD